jgi:spermidine synthase
LELWFTEKQTANLGLDLRIKETLHEEQTPFQHLAVLDTLQYGRMLILDGMVQTTIGDEFVYHEMISQVALHTHPCPKKVLVIGGGDGGSIREILKHDTVEQATLVEIDERVVAASRKWLPEISIGLQDPRCQVVIDDGIKYVAAHKNSYDVILVDSTEPVGAALGLFAKPFYQSIYEALTDDGIMVAQTESPFVNRDLIHSVFADVSAVFPIARLYLANVPTYPSGLWSFTLGSKKHDPLKVDLNSMKRLPMRYYRPEVHHGCFALPEFVAELTK